MNANARHRRMTLIERVGDAIMGGKSHSGEMPQMQERGSGVVSADIKSSALSLTKDNNEEFRLAIHRYTLRFCDVELEDAYRQFQLSRTIRSWRWVVVFIFVCATAFYAYFMTTHSSNSRRFRENAGISDWSQFSVDFAACKQDGWVCSPCRSDLVCSKYDYRADLLIYLLAGLAPFLGVIVPAFRMQQESFYRYTSAASVLFIVMYSSILVTGRYAIVNPNAILFQSAIINSVLIIMSFIFMRIRFIYTVCTSSVLVIVWIAVNARWAGMSHSDAAYKLVGGANERAFFESAALLAMSALVASYSCFELESFQRSQFWRTWQLAHVNSKLSRQLKVLQTSFGKTAADLDSPLEKSVMLIKSVLADPTCPVVHMNSLAVVLNLLVSGNLLTPNFEEQGVMNHMDDQQEAWLFSELAPQLRRRSRLSRTTTSKGSGSAADLPKGVGTTFEISQFTADYFKIDIDRNGTIPEEPESDETESADVHNSSKEVARLLDRAHEYSFPIFELQELTNNHPLVAMSLMLFRRADLFARLQIPRERFHNFMVAIESGYRPELPYHNSLHATDVLHCISYFARIPKVSQALSDLELAAVYVAASIHDYDHPGLNNNFLVNSVDPKAIFYNDRSVLENHHIASAFKLLREDRNNFLSHLTKPDYKTMREIIIEMVLATDLSQHFNVLSLFKNKVQQTAQFNPAENKDDKFLLLKMLMKLSDVSNPTKKWPLYERWYKLVLEEFFRQGDREKQMGLNVSPFMDREKDGQNVSSSQTGFMDFIVQPIFDAFSKYAPIPEIMENLARNREYWNKEKLEKQSSSRSQSQSLH